MTKEEITTNFSLMKRVSGLLCVRDWSKLPCSAESPPAPVKASLSFVTLHFVQHSG